MSIRTLLGIVALSVLGPVAVSGSVEAATPGDSAFDYAWAFASSIDNDPKDRSWAESDVVIDEAHYGSLDAAMKRADAVTGWRRGIAYGVVAEKLADAGRREDAHRFLAKARAVANEAEGWRRARVQMHVLHTLGALGDVARMQETAFLLSEGDIQYAGRGAAVVALGHAVSGDVDRALSTLGAVDDRGDYETLWWIAEGYLYVSRRAELSVERRAEVLRLARNRAEAIDGWKTAESLQRVAVAMYEAGMRDEATETLEAATSSMEDMTGEGAVNAAVLSDLARAWGKLGDTDRARALLERAERAAAGIQTTRKAGALGYVAASYAAVDARADAERVLGVAVEEAGSLVNPRPRALRMAEICRSLGRYRVDLDEADRSRLDAILATLP